MSYESRLYVVNKSNLEHTVGDRKMVWGEVVAVFNLCQVPEVAYAFRNAGATDVYFYGPDGEVVSDDYGEPLSELPLEEAARVIEEASKKNNYRRYNPCLQMLRGFNRDQWGELVVLHYGC